MKKILFPAIAIVLLLGVQSAVCAQGAKPGPKVERDADMESDATHNLEVARHYFKLKKAYVATLQRCEEIIAGNPTFSRIDEVLYMAGQSSLNLSEGKGKQKPALYVLHEGESKKTLTPDEFRDLARDYFSQLVNNYPQSAFRGQAEDALKGLGGAKPKSSGQ